MCHATALLTRVSYNRCSTVVLAPQLRRIRLEQALTQEELAHRAGVDRATVTRAESGKKIRVSNLARLARALRVRPVVLQQPPEN